jgi:hypothetical protein
LRPIEVKVASSNGVVNLSAVTGETGFLKPGIEQLLKGILPGNVHQSCTPLES